MDPKHEQIKGKLKKIGLTLLIVGGICFLVGIIDFFVAFGSFRAPTLFFFAFIGLPMAGIGGSLTLTAHQREIHQYRADEITPVINDTAEDISPAITTIASAVREGLSQESTGASTKRACPACAAPVSPTDKFCANCGAPLARTCPPCSTPLEADDNFCPQCGTKLP